MRKSKESKLNQKIGRPRILEPSIPKEIFRKLRDIADEARMPMQLVYEDALLNGMLTLRDVVARDGTVVKEGMYSKTIEVRKNRDKLINESLGSVVQEPEARAEKEQVPRASNGDDDPEFDGFSGNPPGSFESASDDLERSGLREESVADPELPIEYAGEPGE